MSRGSLPVARTPCGSSPPFAAPLRFRAFVLRPGVSVTAPRFRKLTCFQPCGPARFPSTRGCLPRPCYHQGSWFCMPVLLARSQLITCFLRIPLKPFSRLRAAPSYLWATLLLTYLTHLLSSASTAPFSAPRGSTGVLEHLIHCFGPHLCCSWFCCKPVCKARLSGTYKEKASSSTGGT